MRAVACGLVAGLMAAAAALVSAPAASAATRECNGLQVCVPVVGPWVVVPTKGTVRTAVEYQVSCPRGYIVGGLDAELSLVGIDISFAGNLGSPVNPGITTSSAVVFSATYVGADPGALATARPRIGCIPASGGGGRVPTMVHIFPAGHPATLRTRTVAVEPGATRVVVACASGERLVRASHALGFFTQQPPGAALVRAVRTKQTIAGNRIGVVAQAGLAVTNARAVVQLGALCAGGK